MSLKHSSESSVKKTILIVDDENLIRIGLERFVTKEGFNAITTGSGKKALEIIEEDEPDIALLDLKLQDSIDGLELLSFIKRTRPEIVVIMISGQSEIHGAVQAMKLGARDYLEKPIDFNRLREILSSLQEPAPSANAISLPEESHFFYASEKMQKAFAIVKRLAVKSDLTILVLGESGTGKNYLCQNIHALSSRRDAPYIQIGCSNIPDHLIESELFGYEKGAFTDAKASKKGLIEAAQGGTVLLDELGDMPYQFQSKILKLLEERCFRRIGALQDTPADVRILAATNKDLHQQVQKKLFRLDLFYRLNIATIEIPALRERREDIPMLINNFLIGFSQKYGYERKTITNEGMAFLYNYSWPGNVRQLKNLLEKLVVLADGPEITTEAVYDNLEPQEETSQPAPLPAAPAGSGVTTASEPAASLAGNALLNEDLSLEAMEEKFIRKALEKASGNQRKAAKLLNISRDALRYRLKKMKVEVVDD